MKKFLLLMLAILLAFSLIACDDEANDDSTTNKPNKPAAEPCTVHYDGDDNGKCDGCGAATETGSELAGLVLTQAVKEQFESANSLKIEFALDQTSTGTIWTPDFDGDTEEIVSVDQYSKMSYKFTLTVARTEKGVDFKIDAVSSYQMDADSEPMVDKQTVMLCVDGYVYEYVSELQGYVKEAIEAVDDVTVAKVKELAQKLFDGLGMTDEELNEALNSIGKGIIDSFNIKDNKGSVTVDMKDGLEAVLDYIVALDLETTTVGDVINDVLALIDESLTIESIIETEAAIYAMTVSEAIDALDQYLTVNQGITLQQLYVTVLSNEQIVSILKENMMANGQMTEVEFEQSLAALKLTDVKTLIPEEIANVTIYELIADSMATGEGGTYPSLEESLGSATALLNMTLAELEASEEFGIPFSEMQAAFAGVTVNELYVQLDVELKGIFKLDKIKFTFTADVSTESASYFAPDKTDVTNAVTTITAEISGISKNKIEIEAPTNIVEAEQDGEIAYA